MGLTCVNNACKCSAAKSYWENSTSTCRKMKFIFFFLIIEKNFFIFFLFLKVTYLSYGETCSSSLLCDPTISLTCPSTASGCNCPTTLTANKCDCPTTHYWDGSSTCVARVSINGTCTIGNDYMCN